MANRSVPKEMQKEDFQAEGNIPDRNLKLQE